MLFNMKYFSLSSYWYTNEYDNHILPLIRQMKYLEELTLYISAEDRSTFIDGTHLFTTTSNIHIQYYDTL
jgi:hypothetical protein